jgi:hypothetical protein
MKLGMKLALVGAAVLVAVPGIASAAVVIVRSAGAAAKAYPPGKALPEGSSIKLGDGDMVTVLGPNSAKVLRGPGVFPVAQAGRETLAMAAGRRARFGALRTNEVAKNPSIWDLDVTQSGKMCVTETSKLSLWRPSKDDATKVTIRSSDGKMQTVDWAAGKATAAWPAALPVVSGAEYQIESAGNSDKSSISFVKVSNPPSDLPGAAQVLIKNGCQNQLDLLVDNASKKS